LLKNYGSAAAIAALAALALTGCGQRADDAAPGSERSMQDRVATINAARFSTAAAVAVEASERQAYAPVIVRLQVLLDRARYSPGEIDGRFNDNTKAAIRAYELANGLPVDGVLDRDLWNRLTGADQRPAMRTYVIDPADVAGPFTPRIPDSFQAMSRLDGLGYRSAVEQLGETFHMAPALLEALNPGVDFSQPGATIAVAERGADDLGVDVARVEVDRAASQVRAYAADQRMLAAYPATVGSQKSPPPLGAGRVHSVVPQPTYRYDTDEVTFGQGLGLGAFEIAPGPNNPVGSVWIEVRPGDYGIHGAPEPGDVGKPVSHGGVRLTNWDARELARGVREGTPVMFK
jgi:lipoprotein-anchoring transpeptidase ErfK/SrfK